MLFIILALNFKWLINYFRPFKRLMLAVSGVFTKICLWFIIIIPLLPFVLKQYQTS